MTAVLVDWQLGTPLEAQPHRVDEHLLLLGTEKRKRKRAARASPQRASRRGGEARRGEGRREERRRERATVRQRVWAEGSGASRHLGGLPLALAGAEGTAAVLVEELVDPLLRRVDAAAVAKRVARVVAPERLCAEIAPPRLDLPLAAGLVAPRVTGLANDRVAVAAVGLTSDIVKVRAAPRGELPARGTALARGARACMEACRAREGREGAQARL